MEDSLEVERTKQEDTKSEVEDEEKDDDTKRSKHPKKHKNKHSKKHKHKHKKRKHKRKSSSRSRSRSSSRSRSKSDDDDDSKIDSSCFENDDLASFKLSKSLPGSPMIDSENNEVKAASQPSSQSPHFNSGADLANQKAGSESPPFYTEQDLLEIDGKLSKSKSPKAEDGSDSKMNVELQSETFSPIINSKMNENQKELNPTSVTDSVKESSEAVKDDENEKVDKNEPESLEKSKKRSKSRSASPKAHRRESTSGSKSRSKSPKRKHSRKSHSRSSSREKKKSVGKSRSRSHSRSPKRRGRNRSQDRKRSRSKDRRKSKSRDRKRSQSKDRKRSRSKDRKRGRSRSKDRRSRSRDRRRSRSPAQRTGRSFRGNSPNRRDSSFNRRGTSRYGSNRRSRSPLPRRRSSKRSRSRSPERRFRGRSRSPMSRGNKRRSRSRSRARRSRSRSYSSRRRRSRTRSRSKSRDKSKRRSRSKSADSNSDKKLSTTSTGDKTLINTTTANDLVGKAPTVTDPTNKKSLAMLTEFCKKLSEARGIKEVDNKMTNENEMEEEEKEEEEEEGVAISHPFLVAPKKDITIPQVIFPVKPYLPPINMVDSSKPLTEQFPVSCGTKHHEKEAEISVAPIPDINGSAAAVQTQPVFHQPKIQEKLDISTLVVKRMDAQRRLQTNPNDVDAMLALQEIELKLNNWCQSNVKPGQFTGQLAKQMMPKEKIHAGYQAWAKKDMFHNLNPVSGGVGQRLLQKMGWVPGQVIGKSGRGMVEPIALTVKVDRKGLSSTFEKPLGKKGGPTVPNMSSNNKAGVIDLQGKHPISLLQEFCARRKFNSPDFTLVFDEGPPHSKQFLFKVLVNGYEYQHPVVSGNKKHAKAQAAVAALKGLGLVPLDAQF